MAAEVGHLELAHDYLGEAALMDLRDLHNNTRDGVHIASLAGTWLAIVGGLGGLRDCEGMLSFSPRLPSRIELLRFSVLCHGLRLRVTARQHETTYALRDSDHGATLELRHHGEIIKVTTEAPVTRPNPPITPLTPPPTQPPGREPARRAPL
jgi:alpha,alpha-trehalose phosphorylase